MTIDVMVDLTCSFAWVHERIEGEVPCIVVGNHFRWCGSCKFARGGGSVVFAFRWSLFNRGVAWLEMVGVVVGSPICGVRRAYFCTDSPLLRRILQRHVG